MQHYFIVIFGRNLQRAANKATPTDNIDGKCHITKLKNSRTCLPSHSDFIHMSSNSLGTDTHMLLPGQKKKAGVCLL